MSYLSGVKERIEDIKSELEWVKKEVNSLEVVDGEINTSDLNSCINDVEQAIGYALEEFDELESEVKDLEDDIEGYYKRIYEVCR